MDVTETHTVDAGEQDEHGYYDYYYAYTDIVFADDDHAIELHFLFYDDEDEVFFERIRDGNRIMAVYDGKQAYKMIRSPLHPIACHKRFPKDLPLFRQACTYLRDTKGLKQLKVYKPTVRGEPFSTFLLDDFAI